MSNVKLNCKPAELAHFILAHLDAEGYISEYKFGDKGPHGKYVLNAEVERLITNVISAHAS